jgi:hypothetical protein
MSVPLYIGTSTFRTLWVLSGVIHVLGGLPRRKGARHRLRQAETASRPSLAGPRDGSGSSDGGSANTSTARSSDRTASAGPADGLGEQPKRAPTPGGEGPGSSGGGRKKAKKPPQPLKEMPGTLWGLTKAVNEVEQIVPVMGGLLRSNDEKTRLRMIELLMKTGYSETCTKELEERPNMAECNIPD